MKKSIQIILCVCFALIAHSLYSADKPKTIDPLDHMAAIACLMRLSDYVDKKAKKKYESYVSCLVSRLISEKDADKFFFTMRQQGSYLTHMLVRPQLMPKEPHYFDRVLEKTRWSYQIADFRVTIPFRPDSDCKVEEHSRLVLVDSVSGYSSSVRSVAASLDPLQKMNVTTKTALDDVVCNYHIIDETYHASKPLARSWYPDHQIVLTVCHVTNRVSLYAIPHDNRYKDKDV